LNSTIRKVTSRVRTNNASDFATTLNNKTHFQSRVQTPMPPSGTFKIVVSYSGGAGTKYALLRSVKLSTQIDLLMQLLKAPGNFESYSLQNSHTNLFLTDEV
jgi:hypothetical protein